MKKTTLIALGCLVVLIAVVFVLTSTDDKNPRQQDYQLAKIEGLDKIEITEKDKPKITIVRKDSAWALAEPIEFPIKGAAAKELDKIFRDTLLMDSSVPSAQAERYEVYADSPTIALYAGGTQKESLKLGKQIVVKNTNAKRTYLLPSNHETIFRAQAGLRNILLRSVDDWRSKKLFDFPGTDVSRIALQYRNKTVTLVRKGEQWSVEGDNSVKLDNKAINTYANSVGKLRIDNFTEGVDPKDAGLKTPELTSTLHLKDGKQVQLVLGRSVGNEEKERYFKYGDKPWIYKLKPYTVRNIDKRLGEFRVKDVFKLDRAKIKTLRFTPEGAGSSVEVRRKDPKTWTIFPPAAKGIGFDQSIAEALTQTLADLDAEAMAEPETPQEALGFDGPQARQIVVGMEDGKTHTLTLGNRSSSYNDNLYAKLDQGEPFIIASYRARKLFPPNNSLLRPSEEPK